MRWRLVDSREQTVVVFRVKKPQDECSVGFAKNCGLQRAGRRVVSVKFPAFQSVGVDREGKIIWKARVFPGP